MHFPQEKHSPMETVSPSSVLAMSKFAGHFSLQALQFGMQCSRSLFGMDSGSTGRKLNMAPSGHRNRQKKRFSKIIPTEIRRNIRIPMLRVGMFRACKREKTSHGLIF